MERLWKSLIGLQLAILVLAISVLGLCGHILAASSDGSKTFITVTAVETRTVATYLFPINLNTGPTWALTATGIGGTVDALLVLLILTFGRPPATRLMRKRIYIPLLFILFVSVVRSITAVAYGWSQDKSAVLDPVEWTLRPRESTSWEDFTPYGWSQQAQNYVSEGQLRSKLAQICREVQATWALSLMIAILDVLALGVGVGLWKTARGELRSKL